jgi:hypothetical protein
MRRVFLVTPYAASSLFTVESNVEFARACASDCLARGEAVFASHLLYTQPGILDDSKPEERNKGIAAGLAFLPCCDALVAYVDRGISRGMRLELSEAEIRGVSIDFRRLDGAHFLPPDWRFA